MQINNFYTATIYEKGAEVIRMIHTIIGENSFRKGMDLYFKTFDGQAVRTEDFLWAMQEASGFDLEHFKLWYSQSGTPEVDVKTIYNEDKRSLELSLTQSFFSPTQTNQKPYFFPFKLAILDAKGKKLTLKLKDKNQALIDRGIILISQEKQKFVFQEILEAPILSLNQNFSAPIKLNTPYSFDEYAFLMAFDSDEFNRFEASQTLATMVLSKLINALEYNAPMKGSESYANAFIAVLNDKRIDNSLKADMLTLPSVTMLMQTRKVLDIEAIYMARNFLKREIVREYGADIRVVYDRLNINKEYEVNSDEIARRKLKNTLLSYLGSLKDETLAIEQYKNANNMTDKLSALTVLSNSRGDGKKEALADFYNKYKNNTLVMNKYLAVIASSELKETPENVKKLLEDEVFDIKVPNLVRSLIGSFARNSLHFHALDGSGYTFIADKVLELDKLNPQIASGLSGVFKDYGKLNDKAKALMKIELKKIVNTKDLSKNVYEIVSKILG